MQTFDLRHKAQAEEEGEYVFGADDTGSHACYMIYGILKPGEKNRLIKPGKGHEEMVLAADGDINVTGDYEGLLNEGRAFHIVGEETAYLENTGQKAAVYIIAGGHGNAGHHH